ncbi:Gfo/Idh/MocA family protein [Haladaptatus sp.]|uniref:Gfo/Idh/MocA family protein n=1 Tax=Haladaptatus sp. TaxID=1973141 RepID=UPI003C599060
MVVRMGGIGIGGIGHLELNLAAGMDDVTIVAGADTATGARAVFESEFDAPGYEDYRTLLDEHGGELDGMLIATPHAFHYEQATACLEAGIDVLLEKPMTTDVRDAVDLIETARRHDRVLKIGYQRHFHPVFQMIRHLIASDRIGNVHTVACYIGQNWFSSHRGSWRVDPSISGGGQLYDTGSHLLDALLWVTNGVPETATASIEFAKPDIDVSAALTTRLRLDGRAAIASITVTGDGVEMDPREGYVVWGTRGGVVYTGDYLYIEHKGATRYTVPTGTKSNFDIATRRKVADFVTAIDDGERPIVPDEAVHVTALTEAAYMAAAEERTVDVQRLVSEAKQA